uniref:HAT C-terminal dimerisation domain-containing protein n=1 Tax=Anopheles minimus TaxID=112268 RepID=A0A182VT18_9DIPT
MLSKNPSMKQLIESSATILKLRELQRHLEHKELKPILDVPTRWNSTFFMLERFYGNKEPIISSLALLRATYTIEEKDWVIMNEAVNVLRIFDSATKEISAEKNITLSKMNGLRTTATLTKNVLSMLLLMENQEGENVEHANESARDEMPATCSYNLWNEFDITANAEVVLHSRSSSKIELESYLAEPLIHRKDDPLEW